MGKLGKVYNEARLQRLKTNLDLATKAADVKPFDDKDHTSVSNKLWSHVETNREGSTDLETVYAAGLPALAKLVTAKNTNWFGQGKQCAARKMMDGCKEEVNKAKDI